MMKPKSQMMHISVSVGEPERCTKILAELTGGKAAIFSPLKNSFVCMWDDWEGQFIEFYPSGTVLLNTPEGCDFGEDASKRNSQGVHVAIEVSTPLVEIQKIADRYQCPHRGRPQGGGPVYEVWLDSGKLLIELVSDEILKKVR